MDTYFIVRIQTDTNNYDLGPYLDYEYAAKLFVDHLDFFICVNKNIRNKDYTSSIIECFIDPATGKTEELAVRVIEKHRRSWNEMASVSIR